MKISFSPEAEEDLVRLEEFLYTQTHSRQILMRFKREFEQAIHEIVESPESYPYAEGNAPVRKKLHWKYLYFYVELSTEIQLLRIFHTSEDWINQL